MNTKFFATISIALLFLITSCIDETGNPINNITNPINVQVSTVSLDNQSPFLSISGKVETVNNTNLSTRMMGYVNQIYVNVGDKVSKGQLLVSINNSDLSAKLAQTDARITEATAAYKNAEKDFNRFKRLKADNSVSQKEFDDISAHYNMAKARLEAASQMKNEVQAQFSYANIRAPFDGVVSNKFINEGDMANPGLPLLEVESPGEFLVIAMIPESEITRIKNNTTVNIKIKSLNTSVKGKITEVSTSSKNTGGQYIVKIILDKTEVDLKSGMFATVQFPVEKPNDSNMVLIPRSSLVNKGELSGVYTVSQTNTAILRWLRLGRNQDDMIEVLSGLRVEEQYIVSSEGKLFNGAKISIQ